MKSLTLVILGLVVSLPSFALPRLKSIEECNLDLRKSSNAYEFVIDGSRLEGASAVKKVSSLKKMLASTSETVIDDLGVKRFEIINLKTLLETNGGDPQSCQGEVLISRQDICTQNALTSVCEVRCEVRWVGADCR